MQVAINLTPFLLSLTLLASCTSAPKPPTVDESRKRPINTTMAVELQVCKHDLRNARLVAVEDRLAVSTAATLSSLWARQQTLANMQEPMMQPPKANALYTVHFDFGSARFEIPPDAAQALVEEAKSAPLVMLRGRTDGVRDSLVENRMARERAIAVQDYLVSAGVEPSRIRATYQPIGDHIADNSSPASQALNRRVEIEIYRYLPVILSVATPTR
jgi:outer membrane protein OmpA-like peptidoglycan-associated protein